MQICEGCLASKCSLSFKITVTVRENTVMQNSLEGSKALQLARARGDSQSPTALLSLACSKLLSASEAVCKVTLLCLVRMGADEKNQILDRVHTTRDSLFTPDAGLARAQLLCILLFKQVLPKQSCSACRFIKSRASNLAPAGELARSRPSLSCRLLLFCILTAPTEDPKESSQHGSCLC